MNASRAAQFQPDRIRDQLRERGMRWTPQRRSILAVLGESEGHVTASELLERCRLRDPDVTPSTVYRTLDTLEELGLVIHSHGPDGREEYHVGPDNEHAHLHCETCGSVWELSTLELAPLQEQLRRERDFAMAVPHLTIAGRCIACSSHGGTGPTSG